jgi:osmoprotectant transport system permease protein
VSFQQYKQYRLLALALALLALCGTAGAAGGDALRIGSKRFTESYVLGEVLRETAAGKAPVVYKPGLGNTAIVFSALKAGAIDVYPEYTGTIAREILKQDGATTIDQLNQALRDQGLGVGVPLGFNNSYALAMSEERARALGIATLSDLARHPDIRLAFSQEFLGRADGWPGLKAAYGLPQPRPMGLDHGLAYEAVAAGKVDVMDVYSTDAKIERYGLRVLEDDRRFFPRYDAVLLYRLDLPGRFPQAWQALRGLEGRIDERRMVRMNAAAEIDGRSFRDAASVLRAKEPGAVPAAPPARPGFADVLFGSDFWRLTAQHLYLVFGSLAASIAVGVPFGMIAARLPRTAPWLIGALGVIQTIPALALLAFLIAILGTVGPGPALLALFLYALLPIVRNTHAGLVGIRPGMRQAALALGLTAPQRLRHVELPLALPTVLAGVKTSAVINVGTATIAAFIGAGGFGERIVTGLALNDNRMLLAGALPAAALALAIEFGFGACERRYTWMARVRRASAA